MHHIYDATIIINISELLKTAAWLYIELKELNDAETLCRERHGSLKEKPSAETCPVLNHC